MSILIESGERLGLRALGSGGRIAVASYDQIARTVRDLLGPDHANLFAEPSFRGGVIDWFAGFESVAQPARMEEAVADLLNAGRRRLKQLFGEVTTKAEHLRKSSVEAERILGEMIAYALEVPDERHIWLVGTQPVLTFWGHVKDHGRPAENPVQSVIRRSLPPSPSAIAQPQPRHEPAGGAPAAAVLPRRAAAPAFLLPALLWSIFAALLVAVGVMLLRSCAIGLPAALTGWLLNACPTSGDPGLAAALGEERARQATLQAEYDRLLRDASLKRQACVMKRDFTDATPRGRTDTHDPSKSEAFIPPKTEPAPSGPVLRLDNNSDVKGCYRADIGTGIIDAKTKTPLSIVYCFDKGGTGRQIIKSGDGKVRCEGTINWTHVDDKLVTDVARAKCSDNSSYIPSRVVCRPNDKNEALCTETYPGRTDAGWADRKFVGVDANSL